MDRLNVTDEWLEALNDKFLKKNIPPKQRPWMALGEWSLFIGRLPIHWNDPDSRKILDWFERRYPGSQQIGPMFQGAFYFDGSFWPVFIPIAFGHFALDAFECLKTMPEATKAALNSDRESFPLYINLWVDCVDYGYGLDGQIHPSQNDTFCVELFRSGANELDAAVSMLLGRNPNPKSIEYARMATEMFLKAFLAAKAGLSQSEAQDLGHRLERAATKCLAVQNNADLEYISSAVTVFPSIKERYEGKTRTPIELWKAYSLAQFTGATIIRLLNGRDSRPDIKIN